MSSYWSLLHEAQMESWDEQCLSLEVSAGGIRLLTVSQNHSVAQSKCAQPHRSLFSGFNATPHYKLGLSTAYTVSAQLWVCWSNLIWPTEALAFLVAA